MKNLHITLPLACSLSILAGLAAPVHAQTNMQDLRVEPVMSVRHSEPGLDTWYKLGRFHQENKRYDMAVEAYRQVLAHDPAHVEARNALATVYSLQNRFDEAIAEFEILLKANPKLAHLFNNLGYAHFLKADYLKAISAFGNAIAIEPRNTRAFGNLVRAYEQMNIADSAKASMPAMPAPAPLAQVKQPKESKDPKQSAPAVDTVATVTTVTASPAAQTADTATPADAVQLALAGIVIEISNGTRDTGLGEFVANALRQEGATVTRVADLKPYTQRRNVILYRKGFYEQALAVSRRFTNPPVVAADTAQRSDADQSNVRLVLGKNALQAPEAADSAK